MSPDSEERKRTLIINLTSSRCGNCGWPADPSETRHKRVAGYASPGKPLRGCSIVWEFVTSDYAGIGIERRIRGMRPDLEPRFLTVRGVDQVSETRKGGISNRTNP